jgi:hypothetical protein
MRRAKFVSATSASSITLIYQWLMAGEGYFADRPRDRPRVDHCDRGRRLRLMRTYGGRRFIGSHVLS